MSGKQVFLLDGVAYNVHVTKLTRKFSVMDTEKSGRTMDGEMYRDPIGTFFNYTMTVSPNGSDPKAMDDFWEAICQPVASHVCVFPYGQKTLTQRMYVTSGEQDLTLIRPGANHRGELSINFIAMGPKVTP